MKKKEIEWESVALNDIEVRAAKYKLDEHKLKILISKNRLELREYQIDNNILQSISRNLIRIMEETITKFEENINELNSQDCELSEEERSDKKIVLKSKIKSCEQQIEEEKMNIELNLPTRSLNQQIEEEEDTLKKNESNLKVYQNMVRNKTRKVIKPRVQLSEQVDGGK